MLASVFRTVIVYVAVITAMRLMGKPITVIVRGEIRQQALQELRITASDLMEALRGKEYFSPAELLWATVEPNGSISTAPVPQNSEAPPMLPLLLEGTVYRENLAFPPESPSFPLRSAAAAAGRHGLPGEPRLFWR